jgi:hypothetical protein
MHFSQHLDIKEACEKETATPKTLEHDCLPSLLGERHK